MKKLFSLPFILVLALIPMLSLSSCDDDKNKGLLVDYAPIVFDVACVNSQGEDLLDVNTADNIINIRYMYLRDHEAPSYRAFSYFINEEIKVQYAGQSYPLTENPLAAHESRYYLAIWHGAFIRTIKTPDGVMTKTIYIGEIDGSETATTDLTLSIGTRNFKLTATNKIKKNLDAERHYYLDGVEIDNQRGFYRIVL